MDDGEKNVLNMKAALASANIAYQGLWFKGVDKDHTEADEKAAVRAWYVLQQYLHVSFPERLQRFQANDCAY